MPDTLIQSIGSRIALHGSKAGSVSPDLTKGRFMPPREQFYDDPAKICVLATANRLAGAEVARCLQEAFGGTRLYVHVAPSSSSPLSQAVGHDIAIKIAAELGGVTVDVPLGSKSFTAKHAEVVRWAYWARLRVRAVAALCGISERQISNIMARLRAQGLISHSARSRQNQRTVEGTDA